MARVIKPLKPNRTPGRPFAGPTRRAPGRTPQRPNQTIMERFAQKMVVSRQPGTTTQVKRPTTVLTKMTDTGGGDARQRPLRRVARQARRRYTGPRHGHKPRINR